MSTLLYPCGKHNVKFKGRDFNDIAMEIKEKLDSFSIPNAEFLGIAARRWWSDNELRLKEIKDCKEWTFQEEDEYYQDDGTIEFNGPHDLGISFSDGNMLFMDPGYSYWDWFKAMHIAYRNEWRKYLYYMVTLFGGDRVIYLCDQTCGLEEFLDYKMPFDKIEQRVLAVFGPSKKGFEEVVAADFKNAYLIDDFKSIDWALKC